ISEPSASPIRIVYSMAFSFGTGSEPGRPRQTGHVLVFGGEPNSLRHPQNIFVAVESSTWHSSPMTVSNSSPIGHTIPVSRSRSRGRSYHCQMQRTATRSSTRRSGEASPLMVWSALWSIYLIWGCTYLAIRVADRTLPPFLMAGSRFVVAGALMYGWAVWRGETRYVRPTARQWLGAAVVGGLLCLGGNG